MILAYALFALGSPVVKFLVEQGGEYGLAHPDAISFCNVLFVGNLCAGLLLLFRVGPKTLLLDARESLAENRGLLFLSLCLAALYPALLFTALETTTVTNLVLLSRSEAVLYALSTAIFLGTRYSRREIFGYSLIALGIAFLALFVSHFELRKGDGLTLLAGAVFSLDIMLSKRLLKSLDLSVFTFYRTAGSALVFALIALKLYGPEHFADAFQAELWLVMLLYAGAIVVLANVIFYRELPRSSPPYLAKLALASPAFSVLFAYILLGEVPDQTQLTAGLVILLGLSVATLRLPNARAILPEMGLAAEAGVIEDFPIRTATSKNG